MKPVAVRHIPRAEKKTVAAIADFGVATLHEAHGRQGLMKPRAAPKNGSQHSSWIVAHPASQSATATIPFRTKDTLTVS